MKELQAEVKKLLNKNTDEKGNKKAMKF